MRERFIIDDNESAQEFQAYIKEVKPIESRIEKVEGGFKYSDNLYEIHVQPSFEYVLPQPASQYDDPLIFGKDTTEEIVALEVKNDIIHVFTNNGEVLEKPMVYWMLAHKKLDKNFVKLEGNQHYKYIRRFKTYEHFQKTSWRYNKKDTFQIWNTKEAAMIYYGYTMFKGLKVDDVSVLSFDIEANGLAKDKDSKVFLITNTFRGIDGTIEKKHFRVDHYEDDKEMIEDWCEWVVLKDPTVLTGHNIFGYDFPYLQYCYGEDLLPLGKYSLPIEIESRDSKFRVDGNQAWSYNKIHIFGRHIIDGMFLAVKHDIGRKYVSWGLKQIAQQEGLIKEDRQFYDASKIGQNWSDPIEREKIIAYGIDDSDDSLGLYDLMIPSIFYMGQSVPKPLQLMGLSASGAQLNAIMVRAYMQDGHSLPKASEKEYVAGGMSYGIPGVYSNVLKWDAASYYPSTILTFDIYDKDKDPKAYFLKMVRYFTDKRFEQKDKYKATGDKHYDDLQAASKVFINSAYGILATPGLNFNSYPNAQKITKYCRAGLQKAIQWATGIPIHGWWLEYEDSPTSTQDCNIKAIEHKTKLKCEDIITKNWQLVNLDTDSLSFCKPDGSPFTQEEKDVIYKELNEIMYSEWEADGEFDQVLVVKAKNYVLVQGDKVKRKGSSLTDTKKEPALREMLDTLVDDLLKGGKNIQTIYDQYIHEAMNITDISRWATKKSVSKAVLNPTRTNEQKVLDAIAHKSPREGDKYYLYTALSGEKQKLEKGEPVFLKDGTAKMVPNHVLKCSDEWTNDHYRIHYVERVYKTLCILENLIDKDQHIKYYNKGKHAELYQKFSKLGEVLNE